MAVTNIPNVQNWTVTPQNGQSGYFTLMNTWLGQSTLVIASLQTAITAQNTANSEINALATQAESNAIIATGLANYQGVWSNDTTYSKGQSVSSGTLYYTSKVNSNLNHAVTDTNYWVSNPINNKIDKISSPIINALAKTLSDGMISSGNMIDDTSNCLLKSSTGRIGYADSSGGQVLQATSKSTAVTLNKPTGLITMHNAALAAGAVVTFVLNNSILAQTDTINPQIVGGSTGAGGTYNVWAGTTGLGTVYIHLQNISNSTLSENVQIQFNVVRGAIS